MLLLQPSHMGAKSKLSSRDELFMLTVRTFTNDGETKTLSLDAVCVLMGTD